MWCCERAALERQGNARYLRAILTSYAKCGQLEAALRLVKEAKEEALAVSGRSWRDGAAACRLLGACRPPPMCTSPRATILLRRVRGLRARRLRRMA